MLHWPACGLVKTLLQRVAAFTGHWDELDAVADLRVAPDDSGGDEKRFRSVEFQFEARAGGGMDTCSRCSIRRGSSQMPRNAGGVAGFGVNLNGNVGPESRMLPPFDHGPTSQSNPT